MSFPTFYRHRLMAMAAGLVFATGSQAADDANPLKADQWKVRPLVIVAPQADDPVLVRQQDIVQIPAHQQAMAERELVVYTIVGDVALRGDERLSAAQARAIRKALNVADDAPATVMLVGKDGGVKLTRREPIAAEELFGIVDAMPMRRARES